MVKNLLAFDDAFWSPFQDFAIWLLNMKSKRVPEKSFIASVELKSSDIFAVALIIMSDLQICKSR
jgi:hypothetical protein